MKLTKRIISILLALCCVMGGMITVAAEGETGSTTVWDGTRDTAWYNTTDTVFHIDTAEELAGLAKLVNDGTEDFEGKTVILDSDVVLYSGNAEDWKTAAPQDLSKEYQYGWLPIGYTDTSHIVTDGTVTTGPSFKGTFDGNGHTVSGVYYSRGQANNSVGIGLFGFVEGATIKNLRVENSFINACAAIGGIAGFAREGGVTITDCYSDAIICIYGRKGYEPAHIGYGGILGRADTDSVTISGCWFDGETYHTPVANKNLYADGVGGIVGYLDVGGNTISNCLVTGTIEGNKNVGGIVGRCKDVTNAVTITNTLMLGSVIAENTEDGICGGEFIGLLAGSATASISNSYGKVGFAATIGNGTSTNVWATDGTGAVADFAQDSVAHRLDNDGLKALVGNGLATDDWGIDEGYDYPVPAYFAPTPTPTPDPEPEPEPDPAESAPAQFYGVQFAGVDSNSYNVRFVGTIADPENYNAVGFEVVLWDGVSANAMLYELDSATVYTSILASSKSGIVEEVSVDGMYLIALTIEDVPAEYTTYQIRTFVLDGANKIYGKTVTMTNTDLQ